MACNPLNEASPMEASERNTYDVIVLGVGSMGAATCYHLARRGVRVLGLEQFDLPNQLSSHHGQTRIIRKAYGESPEYVPLLQRAYENWQTLERETGSRVYYQTGLVYFGLPGRPFLQTVLESSARFGIPLRRLEAGERARRFPQFRLPEGFLMLEEPEAGFLVPERCIELLAEQAKRHGAEIRSREAVLEWQRREAGITVTTNRGSYRARKLVVAAGPWAGKLLPSLAGSLQVTRQALAWVRPEKEEDFGLGRFPCWMYEENGKCYYGFPMLPEGEAGPAAGLKLALHHPGEPVGDPALANRETTPADTRPLTSFLRKFLPGGQGEIRSVKICLYTNTPDADFILDFLPGQGKDVVVGCGFSGHGFKFASAVGEVLADLATQGQTDLPIAFLRLDRLAE